MDERRDGNHMDEEMDECRICRVGAEPNRPLFYPCRCSGSIRYTHEDCLVRWLAQSGSTRCELCHHLFRFEPQYHPDAPGTLSTGELVLGLLGRLKKMLRSAFRVLLVLTVWMFLLPVGTCWTWHALFLENPGEIVPYFEKRGFAGIHTDAFYGCLLSAGIVLVFLGVTSLQEYLRNDPDVALDHAPPQENGGANRENDENRGLAAAEEAEQGAPGFATDDEDIFAPVNIAQPGNQLPGIPAPQDALANGNVNNPGNEEDLGAFLALFDLDGEEVPLEEVIGLRGPIRNLFENAGTVLVSNAIFLGVFALVPLLVGRLTQRIANLPAFAAMLGQTSLVSGENVAVTSRAEMGSFFTVFLGYGVISVLAFLWVIATSLLRSHYPRFNTPLARQIMVFLRYTATFIKVVILVVFEFGIFPLGCGWWLDACTVRFFDSSFVGRREFFQGSPRTSTFLHWLLGIVYMINVSLFVSLLREVLRPQLLWFLRNPEDPDFHPFKEIVEKPLSRHAKRMCMSVLIYAPLIVLLIFVPLEACVTALPSVFPLKLQFTNPLTEISVHKFLVHVCFVPLANSVQYAQPRVLLRKFLRKWVIVVGSWLGMTEFVLKDDHRDADLVDNSLDDGQHNEEEFRARPPHFFLRSALLLFLAWVTMVIGTCILMTLPTIVGRQTFKIVSMPVSNDIYSFGLGLYLLWASTEAMMHLAHFVRQHRLIEAMQLCATCIVMGLKCAVLGLLWVGVVPLLAGMFVEKTWLLHIRDPPEEFSLHILYQDWAIGVVVHKLWVRLVLSGHFETRWYEVLDRVRAGGITRINQEFTQTLRTVFLPIIFQWVLLLAGPYLAAKLGLYVAGASKESSEFAQKYTHLFSVMLYANIQLLEYIRWQAERLHDSIRDDKYLVGRRLYNFAQGEQQANTDESSGGEASTMNGNLTDAGQTITEAEFFPAAE